MIQKRRGQFERSRHESGETVLRVEDLTVSFGAAGHERVPVVRGVSFSVRAGKTVAVLGESGCGKSVTARAVLRLIEDPGRIDAGFVGLRRHDNTITDVLALPEGSRELRDLRWAEVAMIFQDPRHAMTPTYTVGTQIIEAIRRHERVSKVEARRRGIELLRRVGIPAPERRFDDYPHQLSGGMCQRAMIAMALACQPNLLIADEPTTALDVTIQAQVLRVLRDVQRAYGTALLLITHDLGVVAEMADEVVVMYLGRVVERCSVEQLFDAPRHPYTRRLVASAPRTGMDRHVPLQTIPGSVPSPASVIEACPFASRCSYVHEACRQMPPLEDLGKGHLAACWLPPEQLDADAATGDAA